MHIYTLQTSATADPTLKQAETLWELEAPIHLITALLAYNSPWLLKLLSWQCLNLARAIFTLVQLFVYTTRKGSTAFYKWDRQLREKHIFRSREAVKMIQTEG